MGRVIPTDIRDPYEQLACGTFKFRVADAFEAAVGKAGEEVYGIVVQHTVVEPMSHAGVEHDETFFIGINESAKAVQEGKMKADPNAELPETWQKRAGNFKRYCEKFDVNIEGGDVDVVCNTIKGKEIMGKCIHAVSKTLREDGTPFVNARIDRWFKPGEVTAQIDTVQGPAQVATPVQSAARPAAPGAGPRPGPATAVQTGPAPAAPVGAAAPPARPALRRLGK